MASPVPTLAPDPDRPTVEPASAATPRAATPTRAAPRSETISTATRPVVGGLVAPESVAWYAGDPSDPLAALLASRLHRSLLDRRTGEPSLAEGWTMRGNRATFSLPDDAAWSDGAPLRPADVADLLLQASDAGELVGLNAARVTGSRTLEVTLVEPLCPSLMAVATWPLVDVREWPPLRASGPATVDAVGEGRWRVEPDGFEYRLYPDELALREAWAAGEINSIVAPSRLALGPLPGEHEPAAQPSALLATLLFRLDEPRLQDAALREALALATDRAALYEAAYGAAPAALLSALLPPDHWAAPTVALPADPDRAAALLERAGWRDRDRDGTRESASGEPLRVELALPLSAELRWEALGRALAAQWATVGVRLELLYLEPYPLQERLHTARWQVALLAYTVAADPDQSALWAAPEASDLVGNDLNVTGYRRSSVAELFRQAAQVPGCAPADRAPFYHEAWQQLLADRPLWPLFPLPLDELHRPEVEWAETQ